MTYRRRAICAMGAITFLWLAAAAEAAENTPGPFDLADPNAPDIASYKCSAFLDDMKTRSPRLLPISIWIHGVASGMDGVAMDFTDEMAAGALLTVSAMCQRHPDFTVFEALKELDKMKKP